jgi:hypothetical protein
MARVTAEIPDYPCTVYVSLVTGDRERKQGHCPKAIEEQVKVLEES